MTRLHEAELTHDPDANARFVLGNIAANGRLFVALTVAICMALHYTDPGANHPANALLAVAGLGLSILADRAKLGAWRSALSCLATILPAFALLGTFLKVIL